MHDRTQVLDAWRRPDDCLEPLGPIPYDDSEVSPAGALDDEEPDEDHFHEDSGNEGCSFERTYRRAALVVWPAARELLVLHQGGPGASVAVLERLLGEDPARAATMAELFVAGWNQEDSPYGGRGNLRARLISDLARLPNAAPLRRFLEKVASTGEFEGEETSTIVDALARFDGQVAGDLVTLLAASGAALKFAPVAQLVRRAAESRPGPTYLRAVATAITAMPRIGDGAPAWNATGSRIAVRAEGLIDLVAAVGACGDSTLAEALVAAARENPVRWPPDAVVVPAALALKHEGNLAYTIAADGLRSAALAHLRARMALPLVPPPDATRSANGMSCHCAHCTAFRAFLAHPAERSWVLKAAKAERSIVESHIKAARCDVDCRTETRGSPHSLVCVKNQASYDLRAAQREADAEAAARLGGVE